MKVTEFVAALTRGFGNSADARLVYWTLVSEHVVTRTPNGYIIFH